MFANHKPTNPNELEHCSASASDSERGILAKRGGGAAVLSAARDTDHMTSIDQWPAQSSVLGMDASDSARNWPTERAAGGGGNSDRREGKREAEQTIPHR